MLEKNFTDYIISLKYIYISHAHIYIPHIYSRKIYSHIYGNEKLGYLKTIAFFLILKIMSLN